MMPLILASASPRRAQLLAELDISFTVVPSDVDEDLGESLGPREMVLHNARLKGLAVAERFSEQVVLAADTTVFIDNTILNKPRDLEEAWQMLRQLSGRTHTVFTAVFLKGPVEKRSPDIPVRVSNGQKCPMEMEFGVESRVTFKSLDDVTIGAYFQKVDPLDKAGGYGIQEGSEQIIERYEGSLTNVIGLPMDETRQALRKFGLLRD